MVSFNYNDNVLVVDVAGSSTTAGVLTSAASSNLYNVVLDSDVDHDGVVLG